MVRSLRTRLTIIYGGLFAGAMLAVALVVYSALSTNVARLVSGELAVSGTVFDRLWSMRNLQLTNGAALLSRDYGFREAVATRDEATISSALDNLKVRLALDAAFLIRTDGSVVGGKTGPVLDAAAIADLQQDRLASGVLMLGGVPYEAVSTPIRAPITMGWVVFATRIDTAEMRGLERLSAIPLTAEVLVREPGGWRASARRGSEPRVISRFVDSQLAHGARPTLLNGPAGPAFNLARRLEGIQPSRPAVLLLTYPLARAAAPYRPLLIAILLVALFGVALVVAGSWVLARGVVRPLSALGEAARRLRGGEDARVAVQGDDEVASLAEGFNAMAESILDRERRIRHLATHDADSGLPNRYALQQRIDAMAPAKGGAPVLVAAIGIDRFGSMRAAIGHGPIGAVVGEIGARLQALAPDAFVARLSEGVLGVAIVTAGTESAVLALHAAAAEPARVDGAAIDVSLTSGFVLRSPGDAPASQAIEQASIALQQARERYEKVARFDPVAYGDPSANLTLMAEMRQALADGDIVVHYQPKLDLRRGVITGAEALVRWRHPVRGLISPMDFIPMAEETGHIRLLTHGVLDAAAAQRRLLRQAGHDLRISINISGRLLGDEDFSRAIEAADPADITDFCFEITETAVIDNPERGLAALERFAAAGVTISIDDFGIGQSSLSYLRQMRAHELKIDKSFVLGLGPGLRDALLVRWTIDLAHGLGLKVTAEGIESAEVLALLTDMGCDMAQGYHVARPMAFDALLDFLDSRPAQAVRQG